MSAYQRLVWIDDMSDDGPVLGHGSPEACTAYVHSWAAHAGVELTDEEALQTFIDYYHAWVESLH